MDRSTCYLADYILSVIIRYNNNTEYSKRGCNKHELNVLLYAIAIEYKKITNKDLFDKEEYKDGGFILDSVAKRYECIKFGNIPEPLGVFNEHYLPYDINVLHRVISKVSNIPYFDLIRTYIQK